MTNSLRSLGLALLLCVPILVAMGLATHHDDPSDPMLHGDPLGADLKPVPIVPFAPAIDPGADGWYGDDIVVSNKLGDIDIRVLVAVRKKPMGRVHEKSGRWVPTAISEPFGEGYGISFYIVPSDGSPSVPGGHYVASPSLGHNAILAVAFADLDGDGFIGITHLDGDARDRELEEQELIPIGRRLATMQGGRYAHGDLHLAVGGPAGAELDVVVAAIAVTGSLDPANPESHLPTGTAVMTRLPFHPNLDTDYTKGGAPHPDGLFALELRAGMKPNPADPRIGERFTLTTDDSDLTVASAASRSGTFVRVGVGRELVDLATLGDHDRLRPGLSADGARIVYRILDRVWVAPDGDASVSTFQLLPLDRLGNVTTAEDPAVVTLSTTAGVRIVSPDADGDPTRETLVMSGTAGVPLVLDDEGGEGTALLVIESGGVLTRVDVLLSDLDVNGSGTIDRRDIEVLKRADADRERDRRFDDALDLNGDGRIDETDLAIALEQLSAP